MGKDRKPAVEIKPNVHQIFVYEERAAMREYDGGMSREAAEEAAWKEVFGTKFKRQTSMFEHKPPPRRK